MSILPVSKSEVNVKLSDQIILVYGRPGIGKSTLCSYWDEALFIATEPGLHHLSVYSVNVNTWEKFLEVCKEISTGQHKFKTLVIDTIDNLTVFVNDYICRKNDISHISEMPMGKGWAMATSELIRVISKLSMMGIGLIMVGHCKQEEIETKTKKFNRWTVNLGGKTQDAVLAMPEIILFMDSDMKSGVEVGFIRTKPSMYYEAKDKSKRLPDPIEFPLDNPRVAYDQIVKAFSKPKDA